MVSANSNMHTRRSVAKESLGRRGSMPRQLMSQQAHTQQNMIPLPHGSSQIAMNVAARRSSSRIFAFPRSPESLPHPHLQEPQALDPALSSTAEEPPQVDTPIEEWEVYADEVDRISATLRVHAARVDRAVLLEDYKQAAQIQREQLSLDDLNALSAVRREQATAVASDDFALAAKLRDESFQGLSGWWAASTGGEDPYGHVIQICEGHSRMQARAFSPIHLADVMGWGKENPYHQPFGNKSYSDVGVPYLDMLVKSDGTGVIQSQVFVTTNFLDSDTQLEQSITGTAPSPNYTSPNPIPNYPPPPPFTPSSRSHSNLRYSARHPTHTHNESEAECKQNLASTAALSGQLAPKEAEEEGPTLAEAFAKLDMVQRAAAISKLENSTASTQHEMPLVIPHTERVPADITVIDNSHFRLAVPNLGGGVAPRIIDYVRLEHDLHDTDPFTGYYLGSFGLYGPELLLLQRGIWDGEEAVIAHKVTGDPNVPAGQVSFRAKVGKAHQLTSAAYPEQLAVSQRYAGEGCVAETGFKNARWAKGELLSFGSSRSSKLKRLTGNAELGFIWTMAHSKRFLILLSRVTFSSPSSPPPIK